MARQIPAVSMDGQVPVYMANLPSGPVWRHWPRCHPYPTKGDRRLTTRSTPRQGCGLHSLIQALAGAWKAKELVVRSTLSSNPLRSTSDATTGLNGFGTGASPQVGPYASFDGLNADFGATGLGVFGSNPGLAALRSVQDVPLGNADHGSAQDLGLPSTPSRMVHHDMYSKPPDDVQASPFGVAPLNGNDVLYSPSVQSSSQAQSIPYSTSQHSHVHTPLLERPLVAPVSSFGAGQSYHTAFASSPVRAAAAPQWPPQPSPITRRPRPFDPDYPTTNNSMITGMSTVAAIPYGRSIPTRAANGGWSTSSLTVENLGQHNQQQHEVPSQPRLDASPAQPEALATAEPAPAEPVVAEPTVSATPPASVDPNRPSQKKRKSTVLQATSPTVPKSVPAAAPAPIKPPSPTPTPASAATPIAEPKGPWATDGDVKKAKPSGVTLGLREIQEAEMKKLEARKAAERERERAARAAGTSQAEEFQPFTASWGLPTSQAGAARTVASPKEAAASPTLAATTPATPVWTNAAKTAVTKKTMKEIQEEEEKRKKQVTKEKETVATAAKRGHADTTTKVGCTVVLRVCVLKLLLAYYARNSGGWGCLDDRWLRWKGVCCSHACCSTPCRYHVGVNQGRSRRCLSSGCKCQRCYQVDRCSFFASSCDCHQGNSEGRRFPYTSFSGIHEMDGRILEGTQQQHQLYVFVCHRHR